VPLIKKQRAVLVRVRVVWWGGQERKPARSSPLDLDFGNAKNLVNTAAGTGTRGGTTKDCRPACHLSQNEHEYAVISVFCLPGRAGGQVSVRLVFEVLHPEICSVHLVC
jgi:hypothetical protein